MSDGNTSESSHTVMSNPNSNQISFNSGYQQLIQFNPASQLPLKLIGSHNFATWKAQVSTLMHGHDLYSFLDGSHTAPAATITKNGKEEANPEYRFWFRQDQLIQNALMASVDASIASQVASAPTSKKAWDSLHTSFANKSHTRIFSLRDMLGKVSKETKTIAEYLREIKSIADELATAGAPISNEELIVKILSGLGTEYREISAAIRARDSPILYEELFDKLTDHELFLKHEDLKKGSTNSITAAIAQRTNPPNHSSYNDKRRPPSNQWRQRQQYSRPPQNFSGHPGNSQP